MASPATPKPKARTDRFLGPAQPMKPKMLHPSRRLPLLNDAFVGASACGSLVTWEPSQAQRKAPQADAPTALLIFKAIPGVVTVARTASPIPPDSNAASSAVRGRTRAAAPTAPIPSPVPAFPATKASVPPGSRYDRRR